MNPEQNDSVVAYVSHVEKTTIACIISQFLRKIFPVVSRKTPTYLACCSNVGSADSSRLRSFIRWFSILNALGLGAAGIFGMISISPVQIIEAFYVACATHLTTHTRSQPMHSHSLLILRPRI